MEQTILFTALALFPFGQIIKIGIISPLDIVVGIGALWAIVKKYKKPDFFKNIDNFLIITIFSFLLSIFYFWDIKILYGGLYLLRLIAYFYFSLFVFHYTSSIKLKALLSNSLISLSLISGLFGWVQFILIPDIKPFFTFGWDEHLYRIVGTFLDPTFLGLILVFGALIAFSKKYNLAFLFLTLSILFTYSRASYLALFAGLSYLAYQKGFICKILFIFLAFILLAFALPTSRNHSIEITRKFSAIARVENYKSTLEILWKSPVFGIGYNNLCFVKNKYFYVEDYKSHACSGVDSGILLILSTTGVFGLMLFIVILKNMWQSSNLVFKPILIAYLVHGQFSNSFFYPWIFFYLLIFYVINIKENS